MLPQALSTARPTKLRLAGFLTTVLGGALVGAGALLTWATIHLKGDAAGVLDSPVRGLDIWEGKLTLAIGLGMLAAIPAMRLAAGGNVRRAIAAGILVGALVVLGLGLSDLARKDTRFADAGLERFAAKVAEQTGTPVPDVMRQLRERRAELTDIVGGPGLPLTAAGGALGALGGALSILWARRADADGKARLAARGTEGEPEDP